MPPVTSMSTTGRGRGRARRHPPELWRVPVLRTGMVTPRMARITVGGDALATFPGGGGDQHVVLYFYDRDAVLPDPLTLVSARTMLGQVRPAMRSYTVRRHDPAAHELDFDFVLHGHKHEPGVRVSQLVNAFGPEGGKALIVCGAGSAGVERQELPDDWGNHFAIYRIAGARRPGEPFVDIEWREFPYNDTNVSWLSRGRWRVKG